MRMRTIPFIAATLFASTAHSADWPVGFSKCANDGAACKVGPETRNVSYGIKNRWIVKPMSGTVACTSAAFGADPYPGEAKKCAVEVRPGGSTTPPPTPTPTPTPGINPLTEAAPQGGWASQGSGTRGGAAATARAVFLVSSPSQLLAALNSQPDVPTQIKISGLIDMASADNGGAFRSVSDQGKRGRIMLPSNITLIGASSDAGIVNGHILVKSVNNVVIRNLNIVAPCDIAPEWDPEDGSSGNWNARYDGLTIDGANNVWIDHNTFSDGALTDDKLPIANGKRKQCHDGALDIKNGADFVTVSNNVFKLHEKNILVGSSDDASKDDGHLKVTFTGNHFHNVSSRSPRVRFGQVHLYNNYYEGDRTTGIYPHGYSIGVGYKAKIVSQMNVFDIGGAGNCGDVVRNPGSASRPGAIVDSGSLLNGGPLNLGSASCKFSTSIGWTVPYTPSIIASDKVRESVLRNAGAGKLSVR